MDSKNTDDDYVVNSAGQKAFKMLRNPDGTLQAEFKVKERTKGKATLFTLDAVDVVDLITEVMNRKERLQAYHDLLKKPRNNCAAIMSRA